MERRAWLLAALVVMVTACHRGGPPATPTSLPATQASPSTPTATPSPPPPAGEAVITVTARITTLPAPLDRKKAELSGLAWHGDDLILLPQYPHKEGDHLYTLPRTSVEAFAEAGAPLPDPRPLPFDDDGLRKIDGFEGFEAIACEGDACYLTIEAHDGETMVGYLVAGQWSEAGLTLDAATLRPIHPRINLPNMSDEALLIDGATLLTFDEANGPRINPQPIAHRFAREGLEELAPLPLPPLDYRITDATAFDEAGCFWVVDYLWPGDAEKLRPVGPADRPVERLVPLRVEAEGITRCDAPTLALELAADGKARNWEGAALLPGEGFLLVTDTHPETLFAFVPAPQEGP